METCRSLRRIVLAFFYPTYFGLTCFPLPKESSSVNYDPRMPYTATPHIESRKKLIFFSSFQRHNFAIQRLYDQILNVYTNVLINDLCNYIYTNEYWISVLNRRGMTSKASPYIYIVWLIANRLPIKFQPSWNRFAKRLRVSLFRLQVRI